MEVIRNISILFCTIVAMEAFSWLLHKYLFHGPLWFIHKTHHAKKHTHVEWNDLFSLCFMLLSLWLMWMGRIDLSLAFWVGIGISIYGIVYFVLHDWLIHRRIKAFKTKNRYLRAIARAHKAHHKSTHKHPSQEFGLLLVSRKWFKKANHTQV